VMTSGDRLREAKPGRRADPDMEAIRNGSPSIGPTVRVMDSNISSGPGSLAVTADNLVDLLMEQGLHGRLRLVFLILLNGELSTWIVTAICFWVEKGIPFIVFVPATRRSEVRRRHLTG